MINTWQTCSFSMLTELSPNLAAWLIKPERLTQHLKKTAKNYRFHVISEQLRDMTTEELTILKTNGQVWERQTSHQSDAGEMIRAAVVISEKTYREFQSTFDHLKDKPIGDALFFNNPTVKRSAFEYAKAGTRWARRSVFSWNGHSIIVTELFTDNLPLYQQQTEFATLWQTIKNYFFLMRLHRPMPIFMILWPTYWGLWLGAHDSPPLKIFLIFTAGVILMRTAGCIFNDIADRHIDRLVERTQARPITSGKISVKAAAILACSLCLIAYILVLYCNHLTIELAWVGLALALIYPLLKRITHLPQMGLGLAFNWGLIMAFAAVQNTVPTIAWGWYTASIVWTLIYDTLYAWADVKDDIKIGIKSTAVLLGNHIRLGIAILQIIFLIILLVLGFIQHVTWIYYVGLVLCAALFVSQQLIAKHNDIKRCIRAFSANHWVGLVVFLMIAVS